MNLISACSSYGMGDTLNTRAFLLAYCEQKPQAKSQTQVFTKFPEIFEGDGFILKPGDPKVYKQFFYRNFGNFIGIPKRYNIPECDKCLAKNAGINFDFNQIRLLNWKREDLNFSLPDKFVTINYGHDENNFTNDQIICLKMWPIEYWETLVKTIGIPVIQIGKGKYCKDIKGTVLNLTNKLSLKQSAEVMRRALFHIDIEGGLSILNQHLGGKSVVLFGPTSVEDKGRSFNLNLRNCDCNPCYEGKFGKKNSLYVPKRNLSCGNRCMQELTPKYVVEQIYKNKWL